MAVNSVSMTRRTLTAFVTAFLVFLGSESHCIAGDAVFSNDGERVYVISDVDSKPAVEELDLNKKTVRKIVLAQLDDFRLASRNHLYAQKPLLLHNSQSYLVV
jgi:hypothetical protein